MPVKEMDELTERTIEAEAAMSFGAGLITDAVRHVRAAVLAHPNCQLHDRNRWAALEKELFRAQRECYRLAHDMGMEA